MGVSHWAQPGYALPPNYRVCSLVCRVCYVVAGMLLPGIPWWNTFLQCQTWTRSEYWVCGSYSGEYCQQYLAGEGYQSTQRVGSEQQDCQEQHQLFHLPGYLQ